MTVKRKRKGTATSVPEGILIGLAIGFVTAILGCGILAYCILQEMMAETSIGYGAMGILFLSSGLGAWCAAKCIKSKILVVCCLYAICYILMLLSITALFFGGQYQGIVTSSIVVIIGAGSSLIVLNARNIPRNSARKFRVNR